jgi:hypothetical protein
VCDNVEPATSDELETACEEVGAVGDTLETSPSSTPASCISSESKMLSSASSPSSAALAVSGARLGWRISSEAAAGGCQYKCPGRKEEGGKGARGEAGIEYVKEGERTHLANPRPQVYPLRLVATHESNSMLRSTPDSGILRTGSQWEVRLCRAVHVKCAASVGSSALAVVGGVQGL